MARIPLFTVSYSGDLVALQLFVDIIKFILGLHFRSGGYRDASVSTAQLNQDVVFLLESESSNTVLIAAMNRYALPVVTQMLERCTAACGWPFNLRRAFELSRVSASTVVHSYQAIRRITSARECGLKVRLMDPDGGCVADATIGGPFGPPRRTPRASITGTFIDVRSSRRGPIGRFRTRHQGERVLLLRSNSDWHSLAGKRLFAELERVRGGRIGWRLCYWLELEPALFDD